MGPSTIPTVADVCRFLDSLAPPALAESWDNVGLLVGRPDAPAARVMTCLTATPESVAEACEQNASLVVTHHPLPFRPLKRLTSESTAGSLLLQLIGANVAVYSAHTAFDSAAHGVNQQLAVGLGVASPQPMRPAEIPGLGAGRFGDLPEALDESAWVARVTNLLRPTRLRAAGHAPTAIRRIAVACGSAGEFLDDAVRLDCQALVTGETSFHTCLEAEARGILLLLTGHFASERFAMEQLAGEIGKHFSDARVWASEREHDPVREV